MAAIQKGSSGNGVIWSMGIGISGTGVLATFKQSNADYTESSKEKEIPGADGETTTLVLYDTKMDLTVDVVPSGATVAAAKSCNILPAIGADVTITDSQETGSPSEVAAQYICMGGTKRYQIDGEEHITMNLRRYGVGTLSTIAAS
jgi:hypothetical protein